MQIYKTVAVTLRATMEEAGINVMQELTWKEIFHFGYMKNPFDELVEATFKNTRSKLNDFIKF